MLNQVQQHCTWLAEMTSSQKTMGLTSVKKLFSIQSFTQTEFLDHGGHGQTANSMSKYCKVII